MSAPLRLVTQTSFQAFQELSEDCPEKFEHLATLVSRGGRPNFGYVTIKFERGKVTVIEEHVVHK